MQCASKVLMVRPASFGFNSETAADNFFQQGIRLSKQELQEKVLLEFDNMVQLLRDHEIEVLVVNDDPTLTLPDAIFPNNWFSCSNEMITLFPMYASNRRSEKRKEIIDMLKNVSRYELLDLSHKEQQSKFLEGTGSMVFDHENKIIYACLSERTNDQLLKEYAGHINHSTFTFKAIDKNKNCIYHTNVMMNIGDRFGVICLESVSQPEKQQLMNALDHTGHEVIPISFEQLHSYAGNMLHLADNKGNSYLLMSSTAFNSLHKSQVKIISKYTDLMVADIPIIEKVGGGSVRCMVAELFI